MEDGERVRDAEWAVVEQLPRVTASDWLTLARWRTVLAESGITSTGRQPAEVRRRDEAFRALAVEAVGRAVEAGLRDVKVLETDVALQRLRTRDDFKALVARVSTAAKVGNRSVPTQPALTQEGRAMLRHAIGMVYGGLGKRDEAASPLAESLSLREQLVKANPENLRYQAGLASTLVGLGDLDQKAGRLDDARRWWARAEPVLTRVAEKQPNDMAFWQDLSRLHINLGRDDEAAADFEKILALTPHTANDRLHFSPRSGQILALAASGRAFARLLERNPDDGSLWSGRGRYYLFRNQWDRAAADFARAVGSAPPESEEWIEHAGLRLLVGDADGCREFLREILRREGGTHDTFVAYVLACACNLSPEPIADPAEILRLAELGAQGGNLAWFQQPLGIAQYRAGRFTEAIRTLERVKDDGLEGVNKLVLAMAYHRLGDPTKPRASLDEALKWIRQKEAGRVNGAVVVPSTNWVPTYVYLREAEALILHDPIFPDDPFAP